MTMRVYLQAPLTIGSGTKVTASTTGEPLITGDAPVEYAYTIILQPAGNYAVNVGMSAAKTEFQIPSGGQLTLQIDQLSKIFVKTATAGQGVNYIWYRT